MCCKKINKFFAQLQLDATLLAKTKENKAKE